MRILWIEDMVDHIRRLASFLQRRGHEVVLNASAEEALETLEQSHVEQRPFDVILLDVMLPRGIGNRIPEGAKCELMGLEILRRMKPSAYRVRVVLITAIGDSRTIDSIFHEFTFVSALLKKPARLDEILTAIEYAKSNDRSHRGLSE